MQLKAVGCYVAWFGLVWRGVAWCGVWFSAVRCGGALPHFSSGLMAFQSLSLASWALASATTLKGFLKSSYNQAAGGRGGQVR